MNHVSFRELYVDIAIDTDVIGKNHFRKFDFSIESYFQRITQWPYLTFSYLEMLHEQNEPLMNSSPLFPCVSELSEEICF